ncbi:MAG: peptidase [Myxococcales bacterium]|nr:peptidase [Myxococcales bacterium]
MRATPSLRRLPALSLVAALSLTALIACGDNDERNYFTEYGAKCELPRTGTDPLTNEPYADTKGSVDHEKRFLRAWIDDLYLWYSEVPDLDPSGYPTALDYFNALKTQAITPSGKAKDQFHFTYSTEEWVALSQSGIEAGYGVQWTLLSSRPPREIVAAYVEPSSPAAQGGIRRGTKVLTVDGVDVERGTDIATLNGGLFPEALGQAHTFVVKDPGASASRSVTMSSASIINSPVQNVKVIPSGTRKIGYMTFNDHIATAEAGLASAISLLREQSVDDLVLDLRYNGGGYLAIASELAYMIAGPNPTIGKAFETLTYNDRHQTIDPFSGQRLAPRPFLSAAVGLSLPAGRVLPVLGLPRVVVITGPGTCSASESVINGLRGIDVQVIQIGATTCGKPYGFYPQDNCGTTYFAIQFQGINHKGYGDYADGFVPAGAGESGVPGCVVPDDFTHDLGDPAERRLAAALSYLSTGACPNQTIARPALPGHSDLSAVDGVTPKPLWRQNRIVTDGADGTNRIDRR